MLGAAVRGANVNETAVETTIRMNVADPRLLAVCQLSETAPENVVFGSPSNSG
jgi:hypothetical protein